ncbi:MAG: hypothetical protein FWF59_00610, partial [Turicibacter sp.]|nr:hypothetical protein [Turicibacter sp.]
MQNSLKNRSVEHKSEKSPFSLGKFFNNENTVGYVFAAPFILGFLAFTLVPMLLSLYYSFTNFNLRSEPTWIGLENYIRLFQDTRFLNSVWVTLRFVIVSVPLRLAFG